MLIIIRYCLRVHNVRKIKLIQDILIQRIIKCNNSTFSETVPIKIKDAKRKLTHKTEEIRGHQKLSVLQYLVQLLVSIFV